MSKIKWIEWSYEDYELFFVDNDKKELSINEPSQETSLSIHSEINITSLKILQQKTNIFYEENKSLIKKAKQIIAYMSSVVARDCVVSLSSSIKAKNSEINTLVHIDENNKTVQSMLKFLNLYKKIYFCPPLVLYLNNKYHVVDGNHRLALANFIRAPIKVQILNNSVFGKCLLKNNKGYLNALIEASSTIAKEQLRCPQTAPILLA